ncbi:DUF6310 domain-containing protein [Povalibacter sp.]|uniref:DUF6310 domain-containing protein n=1 Tax=Povalibacter sp. TaxID=1962978 RepID=UPI003FA77096
MAVIELALLAAEGGAAAESLFPLPTALPSPTPTKRIATKAVRTIQIRRVASASMSRSAPHLGGDPVHNTCADFVSDVYPECGVLVTTPFGQSKRFDGMSADGSLWEVKANRYSVQPPFVQQAITADDFAGGVPSAAVARQCKRPFRCVVADQGHYDALVRLGFGSVPTTLGAEPRCLQ